MSSFILELEAENPERNHFRFYRLDVQKDLFNFWMLTTIHGRIGASGTTRKFAFKNKEEVRQKINDILKRRESAPKRIGTRYNTKEKYDPDGLLKIA
jgi:predicted DNA-binding WGR domain protein